MADFLASYLDDWQLRPFDWRAHNCGHFVSGWIERKTGRVDVGRELLGRFSTAVGFARVMRNAGYHTLTELTDASLREFGRRVWVPERGDIVVALLPVAAGKARPIFGICTGRFIAVPATTLLLLRVPLVRLESAWRI